MKVLLQRVARAEVRVDGAVTGSIGAGLLVFLGIEHGDTEAGIAWYADKVAELRIFPDGGGSRLHPRTPARASRFPADGASDHPRDLVNRLPRCRHQRNGAVGPR